MAVFILAGIMIYNVRLGVVSISSFLLASLISIGLKEIFFDDENRPFFIFTYYEHLKLKLVNGVQPFIHNTFPSGHATQAFAIFSILLFFSERLSIKIIFLFIWIFFITFTIWIHSLINIDSIKFKIFIFIAKTDC